MNYKYKITKTITKTVTIEATEEREANRIIEDMLPEIDFYDSYLPVEVSYELSDEEKL